MTPLVETVAGLPNGVTVANHILLSSLELGLIAAVISLIVFILGRMWSDRHVEGRMELLKGWIVDQMDKMYEGKRSKDVCDGYRTECRCLLETHFSSIEQRLDRIEATLNGAVKSRHT